MRTFFLAVACVCFGATGFAANSGQMYVPFNGTITNPCNGETVTYNGVVHLDMTFTLNKNTVHATLVANPQGVKGLGETTGATYQATGVTRQDQSGSLVNGSLTFTYVNRFDFIAQGSVPGFEEHETLHVTFNAKGTATASFDNFSTTCH